MSLLSTPNLCLPQKLFKINCLCKKNLFLKSTLFLLLILLNSNLQATTVVPFQNLGEMGQNADAVVVARAIKNYEQEASGVTSFFTDFMIAETISGPFSNGEIMTLRALRKKMGTIERIIAGDIEFKEGETYLLFLVVADNAPYWQPMMLSYGIHQEMTQDGSLFWVPSPGTLEMHTTKTPEGNEPEAPTVFRKNSLTQHLRAVLNSQTTWNAKAASTSVPPESFYPEMMAAPSFCTYLGGDFRWNIFLFRFQSFNRIRNRSFDSLITNR